MTGWPISYGAGGAKTGWPIPSGDGGEVHVPRELSLSDQERQVLGLVTLEPQHVDVILRGAGMEPSRTLSTITVLEMKRLIQRLPGGYLVRRMS